jgi:ABC-type branched-subunit amino acid transport system substrate-binding protein
VAVGTRAQIAAKDRLTEDSYTELNVYKQDPPLQADIDAIAAAMARKPDVVVVTGHNGDVEGIIKIIAQNKHVPKAILATNGVSVTANYGDHSHMARCVMMPTQWDKSASSTDPVVGWTPTAFETKMGGSATYQQASLAAVGVAISNALAASGTNTAQKLLTETGTMDIMSFYGKLKWNAGVIQKPMYTVQTQGQTMAQHVIAGAGSNLGMKYPLYENSCWADFTMRIGGQIQDAYNTPTHVFSDWANPGPHQVMKDQTTVSLNTKTFDMIQTYNADTLASHIASMTTLTHPDYVDAVFCPYTSSRSKICVDAVTHAYKGPVFVWGGAEDDIFSQHCQALPNKNCIGMFSPGSTYTHSGLNEIDDALEHQNWAYTQGSPKTVAVISNSKDFSKSVAAGARAHLSTLARLTELNNGYKELGVAQATLTTADMDMIKDVMAMQPDVVVVAGHAGDVEQVVVAVGEQAINASGYTPLAVLAANGLTTTSNYGDSSNFVECVMMPTQWDTSSSQVDPVVGWNVNAFNTKMTEHSGTSSYHRAALGGAFVALANVYPGLNMGEANCQDGLTCKTQGGMLAHLKALDVQSFYGRLAWSTTGTIQKPMYTVQKQGSTEPFVAPTMGTQTAMHNLSLGSCWGNIPGTGNELAPSFSGTMVLQVAANQNQVQNSVKTAVAAKFSVLESAVTVTATESRRLLDTEERRLAGTWRVMYEIATTTGLVASLERAAQEIEADTTPLLNELKTALTANGVSDVSAVVVQAFTSPLSSTTNVPMTADTTRTCVNALTLSLFLATAAFLS